MTLTTEWVCFGDHSGYLAWPERAALPLPAVLVIQEIFGVEENIEDITRRFAAAGYLALAPDLFAEGGRRPESLARERIAAVQAFAGRLSAAAWADPAAREAAMAGLPDEEKRRIEETRAAIYAAPADLQRYVPALRAATRHLKDERPQSRGQRVACVGFCMGGGLAALLACEEPELAGAAIYYGSAPPLERVPALQCPVIGFYGATDTRINAGLPAFSAAMQEAGKDFEPRVYEGAGHGFFNDRRASYEVCAARDSFVRVLDFLHRTLSP